MKFTWASSSSVLSVTGQPQPPVRQAMRNAGATGKPALSSRAKGKAKEEPKRGRGHHRALNLQSAAASAKKTIKKKELESHKAGNINNAFIYVGNLESSISQARLESAFRKYGIITRTQIRCSMGQAVTMGVAVPNAVKGPRDRQYATIEFTTIASARRALEMNGKDLDGCTLVVSPSPADLPEVKDIVDGRLKSMRARLLRSRAAEKRPLRAEPTERFIDYSAPGTDRHRILGFSFAASVV